MPVTVDKLHPENHVRWIRDQQNLEPKWVQEASLVPQHSEVMGASPLYKSHFEQLFELHKCHLPWALFSPPPRNSHVNKRFFSPRLFFSAFHAPSKKGAGKKEELSTMQKKAKDAELMEAEGNALFFYPELDLHLVYDDQDGARWERGQDKGKDQQFIGSEEEEEIEMPTLSFQHLKDQIIALKTITGRHAVLFEKERSALLSLVEVLEWINGLLKAINAKKLQYQKG